MKYLAIFAIFWYNYNMVRVTVHLWTGLILAVLGGFAGIFFLTSVPPAATKTWQLAAVYFSIFLVSYGLTFLFGYFVRSWFWRNGSQFEFLRSSRRQAVLWGFLAVVTLMLQAASLLNFKTGVLLFGVFALLELYAQ